ncbi:MAG: hypothetical protein FWD93_01055 [Coriobacteriia bacterium]|nr:hypothetical protein [Coriobacteriia bacterium]
MNDSTLVTLPFDGTIEHPRPVFAEDRRDLYRSLWSDMVVEQFAFGRPGGNELLVSGVCLIDGAYARFRNHPIDLGAPSIAARYLVARIGDDDGAQGVVLEFDSAGSGPGRLAVASVAVSGTTNWTVTPFAPSPIRIPVRSIEGSRLVANAVTDVELANSAVRAANIADRAVTPVKLSRTSWTNWTWVNGGNGWSAGATGENRFAVHGQMVQIELRLRPPVNRRNVTGTTSSQLVGTINQTAARPWATQHMVEASTGATFRINGSGEITTTAMGWGAWGDSFRTVRGCYIGR